MATAPVAPPVEPQAPQATPQPIETVEQKYKRLYEQQQQAAPAPVVTPPQPAAPEVTKLVETVESLKNELTSLKGALPRQTPPSAPAAPPPTPWYEMLRQGDFEGAENHLRDSIKGQILAEAKREVSAEANESMQVQLEVNNFLNTLRGQNPDLVTMEKYLQAPVAAIVEQAKADGRIKSAADFVRIYKEAVITESDAMRKLLEQQRAVGQQQAAVRQQEVLSSTPLQPQAVRLSPEGPQNAQPPVETLDNYFSKRKALEALRKGMGPTPGI